MPVAYAEACLAARYWLMTIAESIQTVIGLVAASHDCPTAYGCGPGPSSSGPSGDCISCSQSPNEP